MEVYVLLNALHRNNDKTCNGARCNHAATSYKSSVFYMYHTTIASHTVRFAQLLQTSLESYCCVYIWEPDTSATIIHFGTTKLLPMGRSVRGFSSITTLVSCRSVLRSVRSVPECLDTEVYGNLQFNASEACTTYASLARDFIQVRKCMLLLYIFTVTVGLTNRSHKLSRVDTT